jgi:hypothetical protein
MRFHSAAFGLFAGLGESLQGRLSGGNPSSGQHVNRLVYDFAEKIKRAARTTVFFDEYGSEREIIETMDLLAADPLSSGGRGLKLSRLVICNQ